MRKRDFFKIFFIATFIVFLSLAGCFFVDRILEESKVQATAGAESATVDVSSFEQLKKEAEGGTKTIRITSDIVSTDTIFVPGDTTIYVDASHKITRHEDFLGDMFVIGTDKDDKNPIAETGKASKLTLKTNNGAKLFIDGNETNVTGTVCGTAFMTVNTAEFNTYDGVVIQNHKKLGNERTLKYRVSYPTEIGGAAVIIISGSYNMYGGEILNCGTNEDEDTTDVSAQGGAIYNFGQFNMYGGTISNCSAARGGALYNYKIAKIFAGQILNNTATVYGGAIYNPNSQYSNLNIGDYTGKIKVTIKGNTTEGSGGAIFSSIAASVFVAGDTEFVENIAGSNGGAINSPGANIIKNTVFEANEADSKGGALYVYHNKATATVRHTIIKDSLFIKNEAGSGGAIGVGSSSSSNAYDGAIAKISNCNFNQNVSTGEDYGGGVLFIHRKATAEIKNCEMTNNTSNYNAGAIYVTGESKLTVDNCRIDSNTATNNAGAIYSTTDANSTIINTEITNNKGKGGGGIFATGASSFSLESSTVKGNEAVSGNGGGLYVYTDAVAKVKNTEVSNNKTGKYGGAIYISGKANLLLDGIKANGNTAGEGGFLYLTTGGTTVKIIGGEALNNTAGESKGSTIWTNSASVVLQIKGTTTKQYFNYNGEILGKGEVVEYEA